MGISWEQVYEQYQKYLATQRNLPDPSNLKSLIDELKEQVDNLYVEWKTDHSQISEKDFKSIIHSIDMLVPPYNLIQTLKKQIPNISKEYHEQTLSIYKT